MSLFSINLENIDYSLSNWPIAKLPIDTNQSLDFIFLDSKEQYSKNLNLLPKDWRFRDLKFNYRFNSSNLRMEKELIDVDDNFILFIGCSHTVGVGLPLEETYPYLTSKKLGIDYVNAGAPGASIKFTFLNLFYALKYFRRPKIIVVSWPSYGRYSLFKNKAEFILPNYEIKNNKTKSLYQEMIYSDFLYDEANLYRKLTVDLCEHFNIQLIEFTFYNLDCFVSNNNIFTVDCEEKNLNQYYARDILHVQDYFISHPGLSLHNIATDFIVNQL